MPVMKRLGRWFGEMDGVVVASTLLLLLAGFLLLYSAGLAPSAAANPPLWARQLKWAGIGLLGLVFFYSMDFYSLTEYIYSLYALTLFLLVLVLGLGYATMGARRWFNVGFMLFQPSELSKLTMILLIARIVVRHQGRMHLPANFLLPFWFVTPPLVLIFLQPDLGTAIILLPLTLILMFAGGARVKHFVILIGTFLLVLPLSWFVLHDYQRNRILYFLRPEMDPLGGGYSIIQSAIAIGSGGLLGKGWLKGTQIHRDFIPEHHTDFIFAVLGEEWGFVGSFVVLLLYLVLLMQGMKICKQAREPLGRLIACGVVALFALQILINVGMTIGLTPITGLPLPFLSYGGSSLLVSLSAVGLLLNVGRSTRRRRRQGG